eukprot:g4131.t1
MDQSFSVARNEELEAQLAEQQATLEAQRAAMEAQQALIEAQRFQLAAARARNADLESDIGLLKGGAAALVHSFNNYDYQCDEHEEDCLNEWCVRHRGSFAALSRAVHDDNELLVALLLKAGVPTEDQVEFRRYGYAPLYDASKRGHAGIVAKLLEAGTSIEIFGGSKGSDDGLAIDSSLHAAAEHGHEKVVAQLLDAEADIDFMADEGGNSCMYEMFEREPGVTALYVAAERGHDKVVEVLLARGADTDATGREDDYTPLLIAAEGGSRRIVRMLLRAGACATSTLHDDGTYFYNVLHVAARNGRDGIVDDLTSPDCTDPASCRAFLLCALRSAKTAAAVAAGEQAPQPPAERPTRLVMLNKDLRHVVCSFLRTDAYIADLDARGHDDKTAAQIAQRQLSRHHPPLTSHDKICYEGIISLLRRKGATLPGDLDARG